jgi:hypothetical protein
MHLLILRRRIKNKATAHSNTRLDGYPRGGNDLGPWLFAYNWCSLGWERLDSRHMAM